MQQNLSKLKQNFYVVTLTGEDIRCHTLPKGNLGATTAKRQLLYVSRDVNSVAGCSFKSYTLDKALYHFLITFCFKNILAIMLFKVSNVIIYHAMSKKLPSFIKVQ